jgi:hypothetical protein
VGGGGVFGGRFQRHGRRGAGLLPWLPHRRPGWAVLV